MTGTNQQYIPGSVRFFLPFGKAGRLQIQRCQGFAVAYYGITLGALALKPSDFNNVGVNAAVVLAVSG
jgi:hypothetical protein